MPADYTTLQIAIALAVALTSAFIRGMTGFGLALLLVPVLALTVRPETAVVTASALGLVLGLVGIRRANAEAESSARVIALIAVLLTPAGLALLAVTPAALARFIIAMTAVAAFVIVMLPRPAKAFGTAPVLTGGTGIACGLLAGFAGMPGPPVVAFYLGRRIDRAAARASMFVIFLATSATACVAAFVMGIGGIEVVALTAVLAPLVLLGNWLGGLAFGRVNDLAWRIFAGAICRRIGRDRACALGLAQSGSGRAATARTPAQAATIAKRAIASARPASRSATGLQREMAWPMPLL